MKYIFSTLIFFCSVSYSQHNYPWNPSTIKRNKVKKASLVMGIYGENRKTVSKDFVIFEIEFNEEGLIKTYSQIHGDGYQSLFFYNLDYYNANHDLLKDNSTDEQYLNFCFIDTINNYLVKLDCDKNFEVDIATISKINYKNNPICSYKLFLKNITKYLEYTIYYYDETQDHLTTVLETEEKFYMSECKPSINHLFNEPDRLFLLLSSLISSDPSFESELNKYVYDKDKNLTKSTIQYRDFDNNIIQHIDEYEIDSTGLPKKVNYFLQEEGVKTYKGYNLFFYDYFE